MYCKHAHTFVLICGKGNRLKIHRWGNKRKITVTVYKNGDKIKTYVIRHIYANQFWNFMHQLYKNFIYTRQEYFKHITNPYVLLNLYQQMFDDILAMVKKYAENSNKDRKY